MKTLYWSSIEMYEACPQKFLWTRGWKTIDLGSGLGKGKTPPVKDSRHHACMGTAVGKAVELFYNNQMYREPSGLAERLAGIAERELKLELESSFVDWRLAPTKDEMIRLVRTSASDFLKTVKFDRLLGSYARSEVNLVGAVGDTPIGGRADIIIQRDDTGISILDGKNSQTKGKYTDPDQLRWYALCHQLVHGRVPDRLGFVYFRYPANPEAGTSGVDWIPFTEADVQGLVVRAQEVHTAMLAEKFDPTPSPKACKFCVFETVCTARQEQKASRSRKTRGGDGDSFPTGYVDLGFDG